MPPIKAPTGHLRALDLFGTDTMRIRCQCGWKSLILSKTAAEAAYDAHLPQPAPRITDNIWYGLCGYWTDDWAKLASSRPDGRGIPLCPGCGAPGFVQPTVEWWAKVDAYEAGKDDLPASPGYRAQVEAGKNICPEARKR